MEILDFITIKNGNGSGDGSGDGDGNGSGNGDGSGYGVKSFDGKTVNMIDGIPTIIDKIKLNIAFGHILNKNFTLTKCYVIKQNDIFAHGETLKKAREALLEKLFEGMSDDERVDEFLKEFELNRLYSAMMFFDWHNKLTGSCEMGRKTFAKNHEIDLDNDKFTVVEFINITKNDYGSQIIRKLAGKIETK